MKIDHLGFLSSPWIIALAFTLVFGFWIVPAAIDMNQTFLQHNPIFYHYFLFWFFLYASFLMLVFIAQKAPALNKSKTETVNQRLIQLRFQAIKDRLSPHFVFNVMNTLANQVLKGNKMEAYDYITKISGFLRQVMDNSDSISVRLDDELTIVEKYIQLQWLRFSGKFDYSIHIADGVTLGKNIPKALLLSFVENAIRHALFHKQVGGFLSLKVMMQDKDTQVCIQDNGIDATTIDKTSKNKTEADFLLILNRDIAFFNSFNQSKITYDIQSIITNNGDYMGKKITLTIPDCYQSAIDMVNVSQKPVATL